MTKLGKKIAICIVPLFAFIASVCAILAPNFNRVEAAPSYTVKETAFMAYIDDCSQANGNFYLIVTMSELDTETVAEGVAYDTSTDDMPTMFRNFDFFNKVKINGYTLAELGCTSVWENAFDVNAGGGAPMYKLRFHMHADPTTWQNAISAGKVVFGVGSNVTISEGTLIPGYAYLTGDHSATVYRAGCDFVSSAADVNYGVMSVGKTDVLSLDYITNWDSNHNNAYLGFSLKGDDYAGNGEQVERHPDYYSSIYTTNLFANKIMIDGALGYGNYDTVTESYGLFNHGSKGKGMLSCVVRKPETEAQSITIPAGTIFPSWAMRNLFDHNGFAVYMMYETQNDVTFTKSPYTGRWVAEIKEIDATVEAAQIFGEGDCFAGIKVANNDYPEQDTWNGGLIDAKIYAHSENFTSHVLFDDVPLAEKSETFLNVWRNFGYFTFRPGAGATASKITILAGCRIPTYNGLLNGIEEVYVISQDATFVKDGSGNWVYKENVLEAGEYNTSISAISYARDNASNQMLITLSQKDYPNANEVFNLGLDVNKTANLNLYDKIIIDGRTLRSRIAEYANSDLNSVNPTINKWQADCFGIKIPGAAGALDGAKIITIRAGAQFPSYAWATQNVEAYYVTTEEITFVNVEDPNGNWGNWERQYKATFVADGEVVATVPYLQGEAITAPEVPEKDGYRGAWESYTANGDITVNAVYTEKQFDNVIYTDIVSATSAEAFLILTFAECDYLNAPGTYWGPGGSSTNEVLSIMEDMNFHIYYDNGDEIELGTAAIINVWGRTGTLSFYVVPGIENVSSVTFKKGCEFPSYANVSNGDSTCLELYEDVTLVNKGNGVWERQGDLAELPESGVVDNNYSQFNDHYVFSDLQADGYPRSEVFKDGYNEVAKENGEYDSLYGHLESKSFTLSFDFKYTQASYLDTLVFKIGTDGNANYGGNEGHFGWRFYLLRGNDSAVVPNFCVEMFSMSSSFGGNIGKVFEMGNSAFVLGQTYSVTIGYKLVDESTGKVNYYVDIEGYSSGVQEVTLGGNFVNYCQYANTMIFSVDGGSALINAVVGDPGKDLSKTETNSVTFEGANIESVYTDKVVLPTLDPVANVKLGNVFIGWTTDPEGYTTLYPAGYEMTLEENVTLYPVWIDFNVAYGASVRKDETTRGIRFSAKVDKGIFDAGRQLGLISEVGMIVAPTSYLAKKDLTHDLGAGYYSEWSTTELLGNVFHVALVNISPDQYAREFSARGYLKVNYTIGVGYVYTDYNKNANSRSIYQVAKSASQAGEADSTGTLTAYVNAVADITVDTAYNVKVNGTDHNNTAVNGHTVTITLNSPVKAVVVNGVRLVMGYDANVKVSGMKYGVSGYKLSASGTVVTLTFTPYEDVIDKDQLIEELQKYIDSTEYTAEHHVEVADLAQTAINAIDGANASEYLNIFNDAIAEIKTVKTATELANNATSKVTLGAPVVSRGLGYAVTWNAVANADYYTVQDNNDYRDRVVVLSTETLTYKAEVIGNHSITVTAHSYYRSYNSSAISNVVTTPEVKPVFSYKSMLDGLYKFDSDQMETMGLEVVEIGRDANNKPIYNYYLDTSDKKYFAYYNKDTGWSTDISKATDWTSPSELPAHLDRLKAMGNNVVLVARDTAAEFKEGEAWSSSRLKYVMDTAWSKGMKVLVCDEALYKLSMSDPDDLGADNEDEVTAAINASTGFKYYITHPAFYGFSLDDEPYAEHITGPLTHTIRAIQKIATTEYKVQPFYLACLFQAEGGDVGSSKSNLKSYYDNWFKIDGEADSYIDYLYVDIYTQHAMAQPTNRYDKSYDVVYNNEYLGGKYKFYQALTAHTQNTDYVLYVKQGELLEQDMYMSLLYAAAHNVAGYSWFCYFPISGETSGSMVGYDGNGYGNGIGNKASGSYYNAAKTAGYQFELIQGWLDGYSWTTRGLSDSENLLTTTLKNTSGNTITCYVNADVNDMSATVKVDANVNGCNTYYKIGYGIATYEVVAKGTTNVSLAPGQALICLPA